MRLGHSPQSKWLQAYVNYLAVNRKRVIKTHYNSSLEDVKNELEEGKQREKLIAQRLERQKHDLEDLREELDSIKSGKGFMKLLMDLAEKQKKMAEALRQVSGKRFDVVLPHKSVRVEHL